MSQDILVTLWTCKPSLLLKTLQHATCSSDLERGTSLLGTANLIPWESTGCRTSGTNLCVCRYQGGGGGNVPHWVVFALVLISCRVVSDCQADVMDFARKLHLTQRIPVLGDWGKQQGFLTWANSSLSISKGKCLAKRRCISPNVLGFPEEVQRVSVINSVKRADLRQ